MLLVARGDLPDVHELVATVRRGTGRDDAEGFRTRPHPGRNGALPALDDLARLRRVRDRLDREYGRALDVEKLARESHMSAGGLSFHFLLAYGESPYSYVMKRRIERAVALLRRAGANIEKVSSAVGCSSVVTFNTRFTELVGLTPGAFQETATTARGAA